jgi:peptide-methionine (S)-S-oxide reductase
MSEKATFAAGCFWQVESTFQEVPGVLSTQVGYTGGHTENPTYEDVCADQTGHAEALEIEFDPDLISYDELLQRFWSSHDPTQVNRQGPDFGSQYRSAIFTHSPQQEAIAIRSKMEAQTRFRKPIATEITPAGSFWRAEEYHQCYLNKRGVSSH